MLSLPQRNSFATAAKLYNQTPVLLCDESILIDNCHLFKELFPDIELFYAFKSFDERSVMRTIDGYVDGYDVASTNEIKTLIELGVDVKRMTYSNPVKSIESIQFAAEAGVSRFAFQSEAELHKIASYAPNSSVYVRIAVESSEGALDFSSKFGADPDDAAALLRKAHELSLHPLGLTFHVGSQSQDGSAWEKAIERSSFIMRELAHDGLDLPEINIGGGYPVEYRIGEHDIHAIAKSINTAVTRLKNEFKNIRVIAEPGRFIGASSGVIATKVIAREERAGKNWLYLDTGTFQSFVEIFEFNEFFYPVYSLRHLLDSSKVKSDIYTLTGPTCDSYDTMTNKIELPADIDVGDTLLITMSGSYTTSYGSHFNSIAPPPLVMMSEIKRTNRNQ